MNKIATIMLVGILLLGIYSCWLCTEYENLAQNYNTLVATYNKLSNSIFSYAQPNCTAVTIVYYTNFSNNRQIATFSIPYETYTNYHRRPHPYWGEQNLTSVKEYIAPNEPIIQQIVEKIRNETKSEEELANALLDFVQYKGFTLSIRYYPTTELKYPIETLVEMGGDCDTHSFLYATLMKAAGFKVLILLSKEPVSNGLPHAATAVHLSNPPTHFSPAYEDKVFIYNNETYYFAETTTWNYRVGDLPTWLKDADFYMIPV
ncbi:MAG: hypothetical protein QXP36_06290 [Conexivisphaerales archaeon]